MFKAHKWFLQLAKYETDIPSLYHAKIREYEHDLVITQRHMHKDKNGQVEPFRLNYEVLQTCGLNEDEFNDLLGENLKQYAMLREDRDTRFAFLTDGANSSGTDKDADEENLTTDDLLEVPEDTEAVSSDEDEEITETANADDVAAILANAIRKNRALLESQKAKAILTDACNALAFRKLLRGKLALPKGSQGESRYLSCDLGRYLDYLVSLAYPGDGAKKGNDFKPLSPGKFYAPGFRAGGKYCALFRTPHYSRNEHLILCPLPKDAERARKRWFGHLCGVLMIPAEGFAAARLGGADFDGDHVSVVDDNTYVGALERALGLSGLDAATRDRLGGSTLPFIQIPDAGGGSFYDWNAKATPGENRHRFAKEEFRFFRAASENRVGQFSNYAFTHGAVAYGVKPDRDKEQFVQKLAALCGMEIDAAKTGKKPEFPKSAKVEYKEYNRANGRLYFKRKNLKPLSYDNDLTRILWPRFLESGDNFGFDEIHTLCKRFFHALSSEQKANIRKALGKDVPFERTRDDRESRLMESFREAADFDPEQEQDWNKLREQLLNFDENGFCLPYLMLNLAVQEQKRDVNPYYEALKTCKDRGTLLAKTRQIARNLCKKAFPERESEAVAVLLAAHLAKCADASIGKESFFWMIVGEKGALSFLRDAET